MAGNFVGTFAGRTALERCASSTFGVKLRQAVETAETDLASGERQERRQFIIPANEFRLRKIGA